MSLIGAIDLGGTKILAGIFDAGGGPAAPGPADWRPLVHRKVPTIPEEGVDAVIGRMAALVMELAAEAGVSLTAVGVSSPGPLDYRTGVVIQSPNLGWRMVPLAERLSGKLGVPVRVDHDANLAALAEWVVRAATATGPDPLLYVTVSTGIGGGIVSGGRIFHGYRGAAGEVGHMTLLADGPACNCGNRGCLEALASGTALARLGEERSVARQAQGPRRAPVTAADIARLDASGDPVATALVGEAARWLGIGLASMAVVLDPEVIVIGGGLVGLGPAFLEKAKDEMRSRLMPRAWEGDIPAVEVARLGEDVSLVGAALLARQSLGL